MARLSTKTIKLKNGIAVGIQSYTQESDGFTAAIIIAFPNNKRGGVALLADGESTRFYHAVTRIDAYTPDCVSFDKGRSYYVNYAVNGCSGVWYDGKGELTKKKLETAVDRIARICDKMKLSE